MSGLTMRAALAAAEAALAAEPEWRATIAICDAGGHLLVLLRSEQALLASLESAQTKARTALYFGTETRLLPADLPITPALLAAVPYPLAFLPGGIPIVRDAVIIGGIGVGGGSPAEDQALAARIAQRLLD